MDERSRYIHLDALLMGQVVDVRIDGLRAARCPHLVQLILVGGIAEVVTEDGIEYIFVRFRQIVRQIQVVDEAQGGRLVFDAFLDAVDGTVAQIEGFMGFEAAVILAVGYLSLSKFSAFLLFDSVFSEFAELLSVLLWE